MSLAFKGIVAALLIGGALIACARGDWSRAAAESASRRRGANAEARSQGSADRLRICADPNNLPFSNQREEGFENEIASLIAQDFGQSLSYVWQPQRRGFVRSTLNAGRCDLIIGVAASFEMARTTKPYYRSTYVFVSRHRPSPIRSFDDPRLRRMRIGIQIVGDDYSNPPPAQALASRHLVDRIRGFTVYGDYSQSAPQRAIVDAVAVGEIDVAAVWGPLAGYFAARQPVPLDVIPTEPSDRKTDLPLVFAISMAVQKNNDALRQKLDGFISRRQSDIDRTLRRYGVPLVTGQSIASERAASS